ncbi:putative membrane protein YphA (DoxX/SURF4 family) [Crossiella equi]|uniref:Membrane protein YphA (DoxX/SURF4 family) n=1 Tax=Crossiella equi TaxID=130796 RepID=A0ABS5ASP2_9PSEU|nr:DoxX family protein [Crossiella equi]MBP2479595.1 putative membrane protein YphA (DoxX/SURF4 family) [Crossiella equi]
MNQVAVWLKADGPPALVLVRLAAGAVFLAEGIGKFLYPDQQAAGRFAKIGIPAPEVFGPLSAVAETACGVLLLLGLLTRLATLPVLVTMVLALALTKVPILWGGSVDKPKAHGLWDMAHESRTDWAMLLCLTYLLVAGPGRWSLDAALARRFPVSPRTR